MDEQMFGNQSSQQRYGFYKESECGEPSQDGGGYYGAGAQGAGGDANRTNLIVNYLPQYMTEKDLYTLFVSQGPVANVRIMKDLKTGYSYGFGFVKFVHAEDAARAIKSLNGLEYYNKRLKVSYARPPGQDIKDSNLYITNLPKNINEDDIDAMFGEFGEIVQKNILKDKITGMPRGVAFVRYARRDEAQNAITNLNGKLLDGCMEPISVKVAEEHGKQKATYYEGFKAGYQLNKGFRYMRGGGGGAVSPRRGMPPMRGSYNSNARGPHRYNPMAMAGGDGNFSFMN